MALAKITRPLVTGSVPRARLRRRLHGARRRPVTWVSGPPGAGKTTLVADYLASRRDVALWYQVDEGDADVATLFHYLGQAAPRRRVPLPHLTPEYRQRLSTFTRRFFRELYRRLRTPFVLVFDNYQDVPATATLHDVMREAAEELPKGGRVIFISRGEPPPAFARLRVRQAIALLDSSELRFTPPEARRLVRKLAPGRRPCETFRSLHELSDGWAAGLVLLLEQLRRQGRTTFATVRDCTGVLFDYFAEEIFKEFPPDARDVLLQTALLPSVTAAIATSLTGRPEAGAILQTLSRHHYFTNKHTATEPTYRYHPLFREFLIARARAVYTTARVAEIHRAAADLVEAAGQVEVAAGLLRDAADHEGLAALIGRQAGSLLAQGRGRPVEDWLGSLPDATMAGNPWLLYWRGMCRFASRHSDCQHDLQQSFVTFREQRDAAGTFLCWSALIISHQGESNLVPMDPWIAGLDDLLREFPQFPSEDIEMHVAAAMLSAIAARQPGHRDGARWAERALELARRHPAPVFRAITSFNWYFYYFEIGNVAKAAMVVDEMQALSRSRDVPPVIALNACMTVSVHEFASALPTYRHTVTEALELTRTTGIVDAAKHCIVSAGLFGALSDGDLQTAGPWLQEMDADLHILGPGFRSWRYMFVMRAALLRGDVETAAAHRPEMLGLALAAGSPVVEATALLVSADVQGLLGEMLEARVCVDRALEIAHTIRSPYVEFMARLTEADLCFIRGEEGGGFRALRVGMALGRAGGYLNSFVWQPSVMARLCARALEAGIEVEYVRGLVRRRRLVLESPTAGVEAWPWPIKICTLGRFEVLQDDRPLRFAGKVQRKPLALLKAVVAFGGRSVREKALMDALWPDADGDTARFALTTAIHRLRRLLGREEAIIRKDGLVSLDARLCWVDVWTVERLLDRADAAVAAANNDRPPWNDIIPLMEQATELYSGPFLEGDADIPSCAAADRLRRRLLRQILDIGAHWEVLDRLYEAARWYERGTSIDPCAEDFCRRLMKAYHVLGRRSEIETIYRSCHDALGRQSGSVPSASTDALLKSLRTS